LLAQFFKGPDAAHLVAYWSVCVLAIVGVLAAGWLRNRRAAAAHQEHPAA
jgi:hypothetical protein